MELGKGEWIDQPDELKVLTKQFFHHLSNYERIIDLRTIGTPSRIHPFWKYELVEIPKELLHEAKSGSYEISRRSKYETAKPGFCKVINKDTGALKFQLYFDGGSERKLQLQHLDKRYCIIHATWEFTVQELDEDSDQQRGNVDPAPLTLF